MNHQEEETHYAKKHYHSNVEKWWEEAQRDEEFMRLWEHIRNEYKNRKHFLESVNIDDYAKSNYELSEARVSKRKLILPSKKESVDVVADFAGGYMRLQIRGTNEYLDKNWQRVKDTTAKKMEQLTHFRIKKLEEM